MNDDDGPTPRLTSSVWVHGFARRCAVAGAFAAVSRRGDASAGAIFIECLHDRGVDLWAPAAGHGGRVFERVVEGLDAPAVAERLAREAAFDPDHWVVTVEDGAGRVFLERGEYV